MSLLILQRTGLDTDGVWHEVRDPELGIPADATGREARQIIEKAEMDAGVPGVVMRGAFGGCVETLIVDLATAERVVFGGGDGTP